MRRFRPLSQNTPRPLVPLDEALASEEEARRPTVSEPPDLAPPPGELVDRSTEQPIELPIVNAASLAGKPLPERKWLVQDMIPDRNVTLLSGDGGVGKSILALQLAIAVVTGSDWIGTLPASGKVLYVSAEDELDENHRRLAAIAAAQNIDLARLNDLWISPLAGRDAVLATPARQGLIERTPLWHALVKSVQGLGPKLVVIDNLADVYGANENSRPEVRQFVTMLRSVAIEYDVAMFLLAHPSLTGLTNGSGTSGSTGWSNSVRSRLYFDRPDTDAGEIDPDARLLRAMKANYSALGAPIKLRWDNCRFKFIGATGSFDKMAAEAKAERVFLSLLAKTTEDGRDVSPNPSSTYAPTVFSKHPARDGLSKKELEAAMNRLFDKKRIQVERFGPRSKERSHIIEVCGGA